MKARVIILVASLLFSAPDSNLFGAIFNLSRFTNGPDERNAAYNVRMAGANLRTMQENKNILPTENNGDEKNVPNFASQFSKTLEHSAVDGILTSTGMQNYQQLVKAMNTGIQADFNAIVRAPGATVKLVNPQSALAFCMEGCDSSLFSIPLFPNLNSPQLAALMIECYLAQLCRDVHFSDYGTAQGSDINGLGGSLTNDAAAVLQSLGVAYSGPRNAQGNVDASVVFRGNFYGSLAGPYVSQLAYLPLRTPVPANIGAAHLNPAPFIKMEQKWAIAQGRQFGVSFADFVAIENGQIPKLYTTNDYDPINTRYIIDGRDWGSFVHFDINCESFFYATYILNGYGFPYSSALPYYNNSMPNESAFATMGGIELFSMVEGASREAMKAAWAQKWRANRALRPEALGGLVQDAKISGTNPYNLNSSLFAIHAGIDVLAQILANNTLQANYPDNNLTPLQAATYLFAQMYPEASPAHPTYPSGHATVAGACATILKAFFENETLISSIVAPVIPNPADSTQLIPLVNGTQQLLTVAGEIDKLAFNVALARTWAGVHYRCDGLQGILLGEQVGIQYLQDNALVYMEQGFTGYVLTKFDGTRIRITSNAVTQI